MTAVPRRVPGRDDGAAAARLAALTDQAFLAGAGWDPAARVLSLPSAHPLLGWRACPSPGCGNALYGRDRQCGSCRRGGAAGDSAPPGDADRPRLVPVTPAAGLCHVAACGRERGSRKYCRAHYARVRELRDGPSFDEAAWQASEPALEGPGQVSLHGLSPRAAAETACHVFDDFGGFEPAAHRRAGDRAGDQHRGVVEGLAR